MQSIDAGQEIIAGDDGDREWHVSNAKEEHFHKNCSWEGIWEHILIVKADKDIVSEENALLNYEQCEDWSKPNNAHEIVSYHKEMINSVNSASNKNRCIILIQSNGSENEDECEEIDSSSKEIKKKM